MDECTKAALLAVHRRGISIFWRFLRPSPFYTDTGEDADNEFNLIEATFQKGSRYYLDGYRSVFHQGWSSPYVNVVTDFNEEWGVQNHYELTEKAKELLGIDTQV